MKPDETSATSTPAPRTKPLLTRKQATVGDGALRYRLMVHCSAHNLAYVRRVGCSIGPVFLIDLERGEIVKKKVRSIGMLAKQLGLVKPWETVK